MRSFWLFVFISLMLSLPAAGADQHRAARLADLPIAAQPGISAALGQDLAEYHLQEAAVGFSAVNPEQNLTVHFAGDGAEVERGSTRWQMTVRGYGYNGGLRPVSSVAATLVNSNRVEYRHGSFTEWYVNRPVGLEQGFTLNAPPSARDGGTLTIALSLPETLNVALDKDGTSLTLDGKAKNSGLRYTGLAAHDQTGKELHAWLELHDHQLWLKVDDAGARYPVVIDPWVQAGKLTSSDGAQDDLFGYSVAVSSDGSTIVVGAPNATVNTSYQGAAYVFTQPASGWSTNTQTAKLTVGSKVLPVSSFGVSVAVNNEAIAVGAPDSAGYRGAVFVYEEPQGGWVSTGQFNAELTASDGAPFSGLGDSVSVTVDPFTGRIAVAAGAPGQNASQGSVYVFVKPGVAWTSETQTAELMALDGRAGDALGKSMAMSGNTVAAGAFSASVGQGAAYVFVEPADGWASEPQETQTAALTASDGAPDDWFGWSISFANGTAPTVAVGAPYHGTNNTGGAAYVYVEPTNGWTSMTETAELSAGLTQYWLLGASVAVSGDGTTIVAGAPLAENGTQTGIVYGFVEPATGWATTTTPSFTLTAKDESSDDEFGYSVALGGSGSDSALVAGSPFAAVGVNEYQGAAYVFTDSGSLRSGGHTGQATSTPPGGVLPKDTLLSRESSATIDAEIQKGEYVIPSTFFGMHINKLSTPWPNAYFANLRLQDSFVNWSEIETVPGFYDYTYLDDWISEAANKATLLYTFDGVPDFYSSVPDGKPNCTPATCCAYAVGACYPPKDLGADGSGTDAAFINFVTDLVQHNAEMGNRIQYWEIWNEPNQQNFWNPTDSSKPYSQLLRMAADASAIIKAANPNAVILTPAPVGWSASNCCPAATWMNGYLKALNTGGAYCPPSGQCPQPDVISFHGYLNSPWGMGDFPVAENEATLIQQMKATVPQAAKPLWISEGGWGNIVEDRFSDAVLQTAFLARYMLLQQSMGIAQGYWYQWDSQVGIGTLWQGPLADNLRLAGYAYNSIWNWTAGATLTNACAPQKGSTSVWVCKYSRSNPAGYKAEIVWNANGDSTYVLSEKFPQYCDLKGNVTAIKKKTVPIGIWPILLENKKLGQSACLQ